MYQTRDDFLRDKKETLNIIHMSCKLNLKIPPCRIKNVLHQLRRPVGGDSCESIALFSCSYYYYYHHHYYHLLQMSFHSVAVVLILVQTKQIRMNTRKKIQKHSTNLQNTVNTSTHITKTPTQLSTHPHMTKKLQQPQYKIHTKLNSHNTIKYPQYKVTLMYMVLSSPRNLP